MSEPPRRQRIDDLLWPRISNVLWYIELLVLIGLFTPLLIGKLIPWSPGWLTVYAVVVVACASSGAVIAASRERLLAWRDWLARTHDERRQLDVAAARARVEALIQRDRRHP